MRRVWLAAFVFMLLLAACAHPRPAGGSGSASLPAATPLPPAATRPPATPTPMPTPTPTPGPEALAGEIYPYLNHYLGRPEATFVSDKTLWGTTRLSPPDNHLFGAYGIIDDGASKYVLVSNGLNADLVPADQVPQDVLSSLHKLDLTTDEARTKIDRSRAWMYYMENFRLGKFKMDIIGLNGKTTTLEIDTKRFLDDWDYARGILEAIYSPDFNVVYSRKAGGFVKNPNRTEARHLKDLWLGMKMIYYHTDFSPEGSMFGPLTMEDTMMGIRADMDWTATLFHAGKYRFEGPSIDKRGHIHTNIDVVRLRADKYAVYNPFTPDVKPRAVRAFFWQSTDRSTLYGALLVRVTDPDTGKNLYFEFQHLTAAHRENGRWVPENELWEQVMKWGKWRHVDVSVPLEKGQLLGYVSNPETDRYSNAYHVQFGQVIETGIWIHDVNHYYNGAVLNPYTAALQVYFMTHQADKYRGMWEEKPPGSGFWMGNRQAGS